MSVRESPLDEKVALLSGALSAAGLPYAIGGAVALAYCGEPRSTVDIDVNVFVGVDRIAELMELFRSLSIDATDRQLDELAATAQVRLTWGTYPLDLFLSSIPFHEIAAQRVRRVPFGETEISILSCEDLVVFKAIFNRPKDWLDIEQILFGHPNFDIGYVDHWLRDLLGDDDLRVVRLDGALRNARGR